MYSRFSIKKNAGDKGIVIVDDVAGGLENSLNDALGGVEEETEETLQNSIEEAKERANAEIENIKQCQTKLNALKKRKNAMDDINERINALMEEKAKLINDK